MLRGLAMTVLLGMLRLCRQCITSAALRRRLVVLLLDMSSIAVPLLWQSWMLRLSSVRRQCDGCLPGRIRVLKMTVILWAGVRVVASIWLCECYCAYSVGVVIIVILRLVIYVKLVN